MRDIPISLGFTPDPTTEFPAPATTTDTLKATVFDVDLAVQGLPEENTLGPHELEPGAIIGLNDDDDDGNTFADKDTPGPISGENDLVPLTLSVLPSGLDVGTVKLKVVEGSENVELWLSPDKAPRPLSPSDLFLPAEFTWTLGAEPTPGTQVTRTAGDVPAQVYAEGVLASSLAQDVKFRLELDPHQGGRRAVDEAKAMVPVVETVQWRVYEPPQDDTPADWTPNIVPDEVTNNPYDPLPLPPNTGLRIFPDRKVYDEPVAVAERRRWVTVEATLRVPREGVSVSFRWYDVDDPSANTAPVDDDVNRNPWDDNRGGGAGFVGAIMNPFATATTNAQGVARVTFQVSMQPGNNLVVAASTNIGTLWRLTDEAMHRGIFPFDHSSAARSDMLTVWRKLHVERDSMGAPTPADLNPAFWPPTGPDFDQNIG